MRRFFKAIAWLFTELRLRRKAEGKPNYEVDQKTPQLDRAAHYKHCVGNMDGYPPPHGVNDRPTAWSDPLAAKRHR